MNRKISIVMYHYVRPIKDSNFPQIKGLELGAFKKQINFFEKHYTIIKMKELISALEDKNVTLPDNAMLLTFDDGYSDHYHYVYPYLREKGIQGSFFMPTCILEKNDVLAVNKIHYILAVCPCDKLIDKIFLMLNKSRVNGIHIPNNEILFNKLAIANRWDNKETIFVKRLFQNELPEYLRNDMLKELFEEIVNISEKEFSKVLYLDIENINQMKSDGMYFGVHGHKHNWLGKMKREDAREDIQRSVNWLIKEDIINKDKWVMNYPYGSFNEETVVCARGLGAVMGLSVEPRLANLELDHIMSLPRYDTNDFPPKGKRGLY